MKRFEGSGLGVVGVLLFVPLFAGEVRARGDDAGAGCPDGSPPVKQQVVGCFPSDCTGYRSGDWGFGGVPKGIIVLPKFDPGLGTLLEVEIVYKANFVGSICVDNDTAGCCLAVFAAHLISTCQPNSTNQPPVTGLVPFVIDESFPITPSGFLLGSSDGAPDCDGMPVGNPSVGNCTPGEDHFITDWDVTFATPPQVLAGAADLAPWLRAPGVPVDVLFDTDGFSAIGGQFCLGVSVNQTFETRVWLEVTYSYCAPGVGYCPGDGSGTPCPCSNDSDGSIPGSGCGNGVFASGAHLSGIGTASVSDDLLVLMATRLEPFNSGLYFQADDDLSPGIVWGDGLRCAGGDLRRLQVRFADAAGTSSTTIGLAAKAGNVGPGDTKHYQCWYRNPLNSPCGFGFNATNGYRVAWTP